LKKLAYSVVGDLKRFLIAALYGLLNFASLSDGFFALYFLSTGVRR